MNKITLANDWQMSSTIPTIDQATVDKIVDTVQASKAANTLRAYQSDMRQIAKYLHDTGHNNLVALELDQWSMVATLSAPLIAAYLVDRAGQGIAITTLARHVASISKWHQVHATTKPGMANPCHTALVRDTLAGLRKQNKQQAKRAAPLTPNQIANMVQIIDSTTLRGARDIALVLMGWCGALRRSELANLKWSQVQFTPEGLLLTVMQSKTDHKGIGQQIGLPYQANIAVCPVAALVSWRDMLEPATHDRFVFTQIGKHGDNLRKGLSGQAVGNIISNCAQRAGLHGFTGHSLRSGLATAAILAGMPEHEIMNTTRHRSQAVFRGYVRHAELFTKAASRGLLS
jgi:integrase